MKDLADKLTFIKGEVFANFSIDDVVYAWCGALILVLISSHIKCAKKGDSYSEALVTKFRHACFHREAARRERKAATH